LNVLAAGFARSSGDTAALPICQLPVGLGTRISEITFEISLLRIEKSFSKAILFRIMFGFAGLFVFFAFSAPV